MSRLLAGTLAILLLTGPQVPEVRQISQSGRGAFEASLTAVGNQLVTAWYHTRDGHPEIYIRVLDDRGRPAGVEHRVTHGTDFAYEPDIAALRGNVAVAWYERSVSEPAAYRARLALVTREGGILWERTLSASSHDGKNPVVRVVNGEVLCAWLESGPGLEPEVRAQWFDAEGREQTASQRVAPAGKTTWNLNAAVDADGQAWVVFDATAGTRADELFAARVGRTSSQVSRLTADDGVASKYPDISFARGRAALTWFDERDGNEEVYLAVSATAQLPQGVEGRARRITNTAGESIGAYLAWNGDTGGLAWCDNTLGQHEVYFVRFDTAGAPVGPAVRLTDNQSDSLIPAIRPWRDGFAMVWNEFVAGRGGGHGDDGHDDGGRSEVWFSFIGKSGK